MMNVLTHLELFLKYILDFFPRGDCRLILICHCEFTTVNCLPGACRVAISILSMAYWIASVIKFDRKNVVTNSRIGRWEKQL
jgi:hypothetical protein